MGRASGSDRKKKIGRNQQISWSFILAPFFDDSIWYQFPVSQHGSLSPPRSRESDESYSSQYSGDALWWWHTHTHTPTSCMGFSDVCDWILGTAGACQVAVIRATKLYGWRCVLADIKHSHLFSVFTGMHTDRQIKDEHFYKEEVAANKIFWHTPESSNPLTVDSWVRYSVLQNSYTLLKYDLP